MNEKFTLMHGMEHTEFIQMRCMGRMQRFCVLDQVVHVVTIVF
jgi:hypothetical protein